MSSDHSSRLGYVMLLALLVLCGLLLFVLGLELGHNKELLSSFATIGVSAIAISVLAVTGSCITGWLFYKFIYKK